jgi:hypothetical protein
MLRDGAGGPEARLRAQRGGARLVGMDEQARNGRQTNGFRGEQPVRSRDQLKTGTLAADEQRLQDTDLRDGAGELAELSARRRSVGMLGHRVEPVDLVNLVNRDLPHRLDRCVAH